MDERVRILVAMSGGVDSSVAACLLAEQGHDVLGVFMRVGEHAPPTDPPAASERRRGCCSAGDAADARAVAARLGIPFYALNFEAEFAKIIDRFAAEYAAARTPNPCIDCNQHLKFGRLLAYADVVGATHVATGHYARISAGADGPELRRAADERKDQSYVLFGIPREARDRTLFPIGGMNKAEVREQARRFGLALHDKPESQDICFVPDGDYAGVVRGRQAGAFAPGVIRHVDGRLVGRHDGLPGFTIGQRRGVGVALGLPLYVTAMDPATNTLTVGPREATLANGLIAENMIWWTSAPPRSVRARVRIRHNHEPAMARVEADGTGRARAVFDEPQAAVTPGQAAVLYDGDRVLGGGWIRSAFSRAAT